jgi:threonine/homoserine/homoserine lactone efflux protein
MSPSGLLVFAGIYAVAVASPGPGVALIVARALGRGLRGLPWFIAGFVLGDIVLMTLAVSGLAFVAQSFETGFQLLRYAGAAYLCWMAWKIWRAPVSRLDVEPETLRESAVRAFLSSLSLTLGNPKPIVFFLSVMPLVVDIRTIDLTAYAELAGTMVLVCSPILALWALLADRTRRVIRSEQALRRINQGTAAVIAGTAVAIAAR